MDVITVIYAIAVGIIAVVGLHKAYKNDNKITREEFDDIVNQVEDLLGKKDQ